MNRDKIIEDLYERVELLQKQLGALQRTVREALDKKIFDVEFNNKEISNEQVEKLENERYEFKASSAKRSQIEEISMYITSIIDQAAQQGFDSVVIKSGEVHKSLNLVQRMPSVCNAMRRIADSDPRISKIEVLKDTPSHNSSTYTIKYFLK